MRKWCIIAPVELQRAVPMSRQSISFTSPNSEWLDRKVNVEHEYRSNSEAVNDLIRKAREIEAIRAQLIHAEQSGFTDLSREEIRAEIREELRRSGEL
jgi:antitoxin ParD1/3/4